MVTGAERIAAAARAWDAARREGLRLRSVRNSFRCDDEPDEHDDGGMLPCWKRSVGPFHDGDQGLEARRLTPDEQCGPCRERYAAHLAFKAAMQNRGAKLRSLYRAISAAG